MSNKADQKPRPKTGKGCKNITRKDAPGRNISRKDTPGKNISRKDAPGKQISSRENGVSAKEQPPLYRELPDGRVIFCFGEQEMVILPLAAAKIEVFPRVGAIVLLWLVVAAITVVCVLFATSAGKYIKESSKCEPTYMMVSAVD